MTTFKANMLPVLIGSLPIADHDEAFHMVLESTPEVPLWVQLPMYADEGMMVQFISGIPGVIEEDARVFIDTSDPSFEDNVLKFYEDYIMVTDGVAPLESTRLAMTKETAKGFHKLLENMKKTSESWSKPFISVVSRRSHTLGLSIQNLLLNLILLYDLF